MFEICILEFQKTSVSKAWAPYCAQKPFPVVFEQFSELHFRRFWKNLEVFNAVSLIWDHSESKWLELEGLEVPDGKKECRNVENAASWPYKSGRGW